jgi:hypothetical protein
MDSELIERLREEGLGFGIGPALLCQQASAAGIADNQRIAELVAEVARLREASQQTLDVLDHLDVQEGDMEISVQNVTNLLRAALTGDKP